MKATLTSKGQITIPTAIRQRLGLKAGQVLEFDEITPYLVAVPVFDEPACERSWAARAADWGRPLISGSMRPADRLSPRSDAAAGRGLMAGG
ncbi:MAG TPA: AbrB/MazE/SpoVT family DNA-binding domain-containing protein [Thermoanaerobaculia bacterium]|jgi:AbrB family looped-hinge helix DNA binding protein|nr:AbrB/MazE/SpoVT family DNA-binding domain-containing protein [Thermoanaerobaculia bacterium]